MTYNVRCNQCGSMLSTALVGPGPIQQLFGPGFGGIGGLLGGLGAQQQQFNAFTAQNPLAGLGGEVHLRASNVIRRHVINPDESEEQRECRRYEWQQGRYEGPIYVDQGATYAG